MSGVYVCYKFIGRNLEKAICKMQRNGINLYKIKKTAPDKMIFWCEIKDELKIFAIFDGSCYNIRKIRYNGLLYPFVFLMRNTGILIGLIIFLISLYISNMFMYKIEIQGSGSYYESEINEILKNNNIKTFTLFKNLNYDIIEKEVLTLEGVNFVSAKREGNRLIIDVRLGTADSVPQNRIYTDLIATKEGEVLSVSVIRGTALISVGDKVETGQSLIGAYYYTLTEEKIDTFVIGKVELKCNTKILFESSFFDDSAKADALAYAKVVLQEREILNSTFTQITNGDKKYIEIDINYIELINGG
jgi:sporulation protein YqfD